MTDYPPPPPSYGQPSYGGTPQDHPKAQTVLILGILSLVCCGPLGIPAFIMGRKTVAEIDASQGRIGGRGSANAGMICGLIAMILMVAGIIMFLVLLALGAIAFEGANVSTTNY